MSPEISIVVPVYGCADCLGELHARIVKGMQGLSVSFEIIFVNDSSPDDAWEVICGLGMHDKRVKGICLSRNFGQHHAISAGLDAARGEWTVVMDCDLQDPPEEIAKLYRKAKEGFDIVYGVSPFRGKKHFIRQGFRKLYFKLYDWLTQNTFRTENLSFYIVSRKVRESLVSLREQARHISSLLRHVGYRICGVNVEHHERKKGRSAYTPMMRVRLALTGIVAHSSALLRFSLYWGFLFSLFSFGYGSYVLIRKVLTDYSIPGWSSIIILLAFSTGLILLVLGIIGIYLEKIYLEVKGRPLYFVRDTLNLEENDHGRHPH